MVCQRHGVRLFEQALASLLRSVLAPGQCGVDRAEPGRRRRYLSTAAS